jgi:hypothetical protein
MIYVFKTSVTSKKTIKQLKPYLDSLLPKAAWNFDIEDCDRILRIDNQTEVREKVCTLLVGKGIVCKELTD